MVDVETTGFSRHDRVVEVGIVCLDGDGEVIDEYVTLVDPDRDVGPTHVHGITASMTRNAPRFGEIARTVAEILTGSVMVAHNASFDLRFIAQEFDRLGVSVDGVRPVCTMRLGLEALDCGGKLTDLCAALDIPLDYCHSALHDARASPELLRRIAERRPVEVAGDATVVLAGCEGLEASSRTVRGERFVALADEVAEIALLSDEQRERAHEEYFEELVEAALRDGVVTDEEFEVLARVAVLLDQDRGRLEEQVDGFRPRTDAGVAAVGPGTRVCFTGDAGFDAEGQPLTRERLRERAEPASLVPVGSVTKKRSALLVAADSASRSGKGKNARRWQIPVISIAEFLELTADASDGSGRSRQEVGSE